MVQLLQAMGERVGGQSDPNFGRETRMGGHPQPATNFLGAQANSQALNTIPMQGIRRAIANIGEHRTILYQQFEKNRNDWIGQIFGEDDGQQIWDVISTDNMVTGSLRFDVHALSELHNPDAERQKTILIDQVFTNYVTTVAKMIEVAENPQAPPAMKQLMQQAVTAKGEALTRFLEASDIDNIEDYVYQLQEQQNGDLNAIRQALAAAAGGGQGPPGAANGPVQQSVLASIPRGAGQGSRGSPRSRGSDSLFGGG
jgi:hypothetical protein